VQGQYKSSKLRCVYYRGCGCTHVLGPFYASPLVQECGCHCHCSNVIIDTAAVSVYADSS
jgi:hypothetical protein